MLINSVTRASLRGVSALEAAARVHYAEAKIPKGAHVLREGLWDVGCRAHYADPQGCACLEGGALGCRVHHVEAQIPKDADI